MQSSHLNSLLLLLYPPKEYNGTPNKCIIYLSWYPCGRAADWTLSHVSTHVTIVHLSILRCIWSPRSGSSLLTHSNTKEFKQVHIVSRVLLDSHCQDMDFHFINCARYWWWYWWSFCYRKLIPTLSAESVSPHLDLTCLKTLFTMTRQVPGFYLATFRYLELSDFNTADNHLVLCNNIFTAPRPPFKYFLGLVSINTSLSSLSSKRLEFFHYRCYLSASIDISMMTLEVIIILFISGQ